MTNALETTDALKARIDKIRQIVAPDLDDTELSFYLEYCRKTGLDPITRQIFAQKRRSKNARGEWENKITIGTSIDGQRLVAQRTGEYEGQVGPFWCGPDGRWVDVWLKPNPPSAARIGVLRRGFKEPVWAVAVFESYVQRRQDGQPTQMWVKMPDVMIAKCAEALALRKAFPNELSGLYADEEMQQADNPDKDSKPKVTAPKPTHAVSGGHSSTSVPEVKGQGEVDSPTVLPGPIGTRSASPDASLNESPTDEEIERFQAHCKKHGWKNSQVVDLIRARYKKATPRTCSIEQLDEIAEIIRVRTPAQALNIPVKTDFPRELDHKPIELSDASEPPGEYDPSFDFGLDLAQENEKRK